MGSLAVELNSVLQLDEQGLINQEEMHTKVSALQDQLLKLPQADIRTYHAFYPGVYERTIICPPWTILTGAAHLSDYSVRLDQGTIAVTIDDGVRVLSAPLSFNAKTGAKRAGRVFDEQVIWTDIYPNPDNCRDLEELERRLYKTDEHAPLQDDLKAKTLMVAKADYQLFLTQLGATAEEVYQIAAKTDDLISMPEGFDVVRAPSEISGEGIFATRDFAVGEVVCPTRIGNKRTPAGRYVNHSPYFNVVPRTTADENVDFVASRVIYAGEEILTDYRSSMRVNFGVTLQGELL